MGEELVDNPKLIPILKDAYDLLVLLEREEALCMKQIKKLEEEKKRLKDKQNNL